MNKILHQEDLNELTNKLGYDDNEFIPANVLTICFNNGFKMQLKSERGQFVITKVPLIHIETLENGEKEAFQVYEISCENGLFTFSINQVQNMFLRSEE